MRLIDAEGSELQTQLKIIREAEYQIYGSGSWGFTTKCEHAIEDAPTIQPEPHWIPVTEIPKEEEKSYWVCLEDGGQCQCRWTNDIYGLGANEWSKWGWKKVDLPQFSKVVAYMPLPEPFKGVTT